MNENSAQSIVARLQTATNILVTVSTNPSVDQLAACIGLTLSLNKLGKHATAVFSGQVPSTIEFLKPSETLEKTTDSLRDFIIALDKSKADKLRYKVEDNFVKIFITPYKTSLSQKDLQFSQGDFNVDVVLALGVHAQSDLDGAITSHGRILHDATVISINNQQSAELGSINWVDLNCSSLSEMLVNLTRQLGPQIIDAQIATAYLTGIVAETDRFSNERTSAITMNVAAQLMSAGANQQLVATKLEAESDQKEAVKPKAEPPKATQPKPATTVMAPKTPIAAAKPPVSTPKPSTLPQPPAPPVPMPPKPAAPPAPLAPVQSLPPPTEEPHAKTVELSDVDKLLGTKKPAEAIDEESENGLPPSAEINIDHDGHLHKATDEAGLSEPAASAPPPPAEPLRLTTEKPAFGGRLTANSEPEPLDPATDPLTLPPVRGPLLTHGSPSLGSPTSPFTTPPQPLANQPAPPPPPPPTPLPQPVMPPTPPTPPTPHATTPTTEGLNEARSAVEQAINGTPQPLDPLSALNAQPVDLGLPGEGSRPTLQPAPSVPQPSAPPLANVPMQPLSTAPPSSIKPPPVPPPMMPPSFMTPPPAAGSQNPNYPSEGATGQPPVAL